VNREAVRTCMHVFRVKLSLKVFSVDQYENGIGSVLKNFALSHFCVLVYRRSYGESLIDVREGCQCPCTE